jgi:hypothetical protein
MEVLKIIVTVVALLLQLSKAKLFNASLHANGRMPTSAVYIPCRKKIRRMSPISEK